MMIKMLLALCVLAQVCAEEYLSRPEWQQAVLTPEDKDRLNLFRKIYETAQSGREARDEIPQVLHAISLGPALLQEASLQKLRSWADKHPGWQLKLWVDRDFSAPIAGLQLITADQFPLNAYTDMYYQAESYEERSLLLRYAILESEGGVYIDLDSLCICSLEPLRAGYDFFCGLEEPGVSQRSSSINPSCGLIGAAAHHPILQCTEEWLINHWRGYEELLPGADSISVDNRMMHRSAGALSVGIERASLQDGRKDTVFPPEYFSTSMRSSARYAVSSPKALFGRRAQQTEAKEKIEEGFSQIRSELRLSLYLILALAVLNLFLGAVIFHLYRTRKKK
jgi:Glycosyltransferase sugar-binding region containing DXD motif